ncbi:retrovirus-related pol polyprotein from transposon TNT 1-94 [Tanacetum coccineum]
MWRKTFVRTKPNIVKNVAFLPISTCFVRDLQGNDLLTGNHGSDLYTISLQETTSSTPIYFMAKASPTQAWINFVLLCSKFQRKAEFASHGLAEAVATACYTQNRSIIISTHGKTTYHINNDKKPSIKHLHIFGCICYITRDGENLYKMKEKGDPCVMVGCYTQSKGYRVYNKRTRLIVESIHIKFDEIKEMMSDHNSSDLAPQRQEMSVENVSLGLVPQGQKASDKRKRYAQEEVLILKKSFAPVARLESSSRFRCPTAAHNSLPSII